MLKKLILFCGIALTSSMATAQTFYLDEDFENGLPAGWSQSTLATDGGWNAGTGAALGSTSFPITAHTNIVATNDDACNCDKSADSLFTDTVDLTGASGLVVLAYDQYYYELAYQGATENLTIAAYSVNNGTWSVLSDVPPGANFGTWDDGQTLDLSAYIGDQVILAFVYDDDGGWVYGAALDNVSVYDAPQYDVSNVSIDNALYNETAISTDIVGTVKNMGSETVTSMEVTYSIEGGAAVSAVISGLSIAPLATYQYTHPTAWVPAMATSAFVEGQSIETTVTLVNGNADADPSDNTVNRDVNVHVPGVQRTPLLEQFTSSTCPPCLPGNTNVLGILQNYPGEYTKICYQSDFPGSGDPYFTEEVGVRRGYYGVNSIPTMFTDGANGLNSNSYTSALFENALSVPAFTNLTVAGEITPTYTASVVGGEIVIDTTYELEASATINPTVDLPAGYRAFMSIQEDLTSNNVKTNGETEFHDVMKKMLPGTSGTILAAMAANDNVVVEESHSFPGSYILPANAGSPVDHSQNHTVEEWNDLRMAAWVQDFNTGEVLQSANAEVTLNDPVQNWTEEVVDGTTIYTIDGVEYEDFNGVIAPLGTTDIFGATVSIFPNPAKDVLNVTGVSSNATVAIYDAMGRMVRNQAIQNNGINVADLNTGVYNLVIIDGEQRTTKRVSVIH